MATDSTACRRSAPLAPIGNRGVLFTPMASLGQWANRCSLIRYVHDHHRGFRVEDHLFGFALVKQLTPETTVFGDHYG